MSEKHVYEECVRLYHAAGCDVIRFAQSRPTNQTPGIPDLKVYHAPSGATWWHEVKAEGGRVSPYQRVFHRLAEECGESIVVGDATAALEYLRTRRLIVSTVEDYTRRGYLERAR